jgi:hypothetical protein
MSGATQATQTQRPRRHVAVVGCTNATYPSHDTLSTKDAAPEAPAVVDGGARALKTTGAGGKAKDAANEADEGDEFVGTTVQKEFPGFGTFRGRVRSAKKSRTCFYICQHIHDTRGTWHGV